MAAGGGAGGLKSIMQHTNDECVCGFGSCKMGGHQQSVLNIF